MLFLVLDLKNLKYQMKLKLELLIFQLFKENL